MSGVFADAYYFLALINEDDAAHELASSMAASIRTPMVTTEYILVEVADGVADEHWRGRMRPFIETLRASPSVEIVAADTELLNRGLALYSARPDKGWSLTDCISFVVMRERKLTEALTHDHHFKQAGFRVLL